MTKFSWWVQHLIELAHHNSLASFKQQLIFKEKRGSCSPVLLAAMYNEGQCTVDAVVHVDLEFCPLSVSNWCKIW